MQDKTFSIFSR